MKHALLKITSALALAGAMTAAQAVPVNWTIDAPLRLVTYRFDPIAFASLTGSFTYDASTIQLTNVNLQVSGDFDIGSLNLSLGNQTLSLEASNGAKLVLKYTDSLDPSKSGPWATGQIGSFNLVTSSAMPQLGMTYVDVDPGVGATLESTAGATAAVPEPQTVALMAAGLGLLGAAVRRRQPRV